MQTKIIERYFFFGLLFATIFFTFMIFKPFWIVLVLGVCFSIVLHPIYEWLRKGKLPNWLASVLTVIFFIIVLCGPLFSIGVLVFNQSQDLYQNISEGQHVEPFLDKVDSKINRILPASLTFDASEKASDFISYISSNVAKIFGSTLSAFFSFLLMLLSIFYFLKDGTKWRKALIILSPLSDKDDQKIITRLSLSVNAVIKGYLLIALLQGLLMGLGLWFFNVPNAALWGVVAAIASMVPSIGTSFVSVPAIIFLYFTAGTGAAIGLLIWAVAIVGTVDNILSPMLISGKTHMPPFLILFSVLGGISLLGPVGILMGPLTLSLLYTLVAIYRNEFQPNPTESP